MQASALHGGSGHDGASQRRTELPCRWPVAYRRGRPALPRTQEPRPMSYDELEILTTAQVMERCLVPRRTVTTWVSTPGFQALLHRGQRGRRDDPNIYHWPTL